VHSLGARVGLSRSLAVSHTLLSQPASAGEVGGSRLTESRYLERRAGDARVRHRVWDLDQRRDAAERLGQHEQSRRLEDPDRLVARASASPSLDNDAGARSQGRTQT